TLRVRTSPTLALSGGEDCPARLSFFPAVLVQSRRKFASLEPICRGSLMHPSEQSPPAVQWMVLGGGVYQVCGRTVPRLPAGPYTCMMDSHGNCQFHAKTLKVDDLIDFPDSLPSRILREIGEFWKLGTRFRQYGFLHRRGYLFYGKQGGGKSSLI